MVRQIASPRPLPPFWRESEASTCWNRPKIVSSLSAGMPRPWSITESVTPLAPGRSITEMVELGGENLTAFDSRLVITCSRRSASPVISTWVLSWISCTPAASATGCMPSIAWCTICAELHRPEGDGLAAALDALQVENVVDQPDQPVGVADGDAQQVAGLFVESRPACRTKAGRALRESRSAAFAVRGSPSRRTHPSCGRAHSAG